MDVHVKFGEPKFEDSADCALITESEPSCEQDSLCEEMSSQVSLVPANMAARPPVQWSVREVKVWLEFCATEFSLPSICVNKFDMNGKALTLLTRTDFLERAPQAGDILYNVFQRCLLQERPGYLRPPGFLPTPTHLTLPAPEILSRHHQIHSLRSSYIPILPQPSSSGSKSIYPASSSSIMLAAGDESVSGGLGVPASMLSPAPSEKCPSDSDSSHNENGQSPPRSSDNEMDYEDGVNFDPGSDVKGDTPNQNSDGVCRLLWEFIYQLLQDDKWSELVSWESEGELTFRILNPTNLADAWGKQKNRSNMTYEKLSRALRYYYKMNIIKKVPGKRLTYKFLQHPAAIRKGQRGARPHSSRNAKASAADPDHEVATPDSSTFLPPRALSISSTTSSTATSLSNDTRKGAHSPKQHFSPDELSQGSVKSSFRRDIEDRHFLGSSQRILGSSQDRGTFLYQEAADHTAARTTMNARSFRNGSSGKHLEAIQNQPSFLYNDQGHCEPEDNDFVYRSQLDAFNASPKTNAKSLVEMDKGINSAQILQLNSTPFYGDKNHLPSHIPEPHSHVFTYDDVQQHSPTQKDIFPGACLPPSGAPPVFQSRATLRFSESNRLTDNVYAKFYSPPHFHPYPQLLSLSRTPSPLPPYASPMQRLSHVPSEPHRSVTTGQKSQATHTFPPAPSSSTNATLQYCAPHSFKKEACDGEQEEPQDLSLKTSRKKLYSSKDIAHADLPRESGTEDAHRESPRSNSSDSAYSSDRADCAKEEAPESID